MVIPSESKTMMGYAEEILRMLFRRAPQDFEHLYQVMSQKGKSFLGEKPDSEPASSSQRVEYFLRDAFVESPQEFMTFIETLPAKKIEWIDREQRFQEFLTKVDGLIADNAKLQDSEEWLRSFGETFKDSLIFWGDLSSDSPERLKNLGDILINIFTEKNLSLSTVSRAVSNFDENSLVDVLFCGTKLSAFVDRIKNMTKQQQSEELAVDLVAFHLVRLGYGKDFVDMLEGMDNLQLLAVLNAKETLFALMLKKDNVLKIDVGDLQRQRFLRLLRSKPRLLLVDIFSSSNVTIPASAFLSDQGHFDGMFSEFATFVP